jgi:tetratricopeptide (TPR) repeat protein/glutathione synthase/RimK-type ligase-like ATP-grasp enzyme
MGAAISRTCALARYLEQRIADTPELELLAPVELNVVCFRYRADDPDRINAEIVVRLQEAGSVAPSTTIIDGQLAIRAAIVNHRTAQEDIDKLLDQTLAYGRMLMSAARTGCAAPKDTPSDVPPRVNWERALLAVESQLASNPDSINLRLQRALLFSQLGRLADARDDYIKVLEREPHHLVALNNLGCVLIAMGNRKAARLAFQEAVRQHPDDVMSRANLGQFLFEESDQVLAHGQPEQALQLKQEARAHFEQILRVKPDETKAHEGLAHILRDLGEAEKAEWHRAAAFGKRSIFPLPYRGQGAPIPLLLLASTTGGNVRLQKFLDDRIFQTYVVAPEFYDPKTPLPEHALVVNGIGDAELSARALAAAQALLDRTTAPVINAPAAVLATSRSDNATRLAGLPGVVTPITRTLPREQLSSPDAASLLAGCGFQFPLLLRSPGFHTGLHFLRVENLQSLPASLAELPGQELIVMQYLDACGKDGKTRKYRVMMIDGQLYPLHCAISSHWKIHYFTAEMAGNPDHRSEDAAFLENMPEALGPRAMNALHQIQAVLGLDYGGIDFGLNANGEVLVFEANATMVVNPPDPGEQWQYRWPAYQRIQSAIHKMLMEKAGASRRLADRATDAGINC